MLALSVIQEINLPRYAEFLHDTDNRDNYRAYSKLGSS